MLLGVIAAKYEKSLHKICGFFPTLIFTLISFVSYFCIMKVGKGHLDNSYYTQLLGYIPLLLFLVFIYKLACFNWIRNLAETNYFKPIRIIAALTFEIYIVQKYIITNYFNALFPFNAIIVFLLILIAAYIVKIATNLFEQTVIGIKWDIKKAVTLI